MTSIVVIGSLNMDLVAVSPRLPAPGETVLGREYWMVPGGKGANQAYAAARLGGSVRMLGRVGQDAHASQMLDNLRAVGCRVEGVRPVATHSGVALILVADSGQNSIVVVPGANAQFEPQDIQTEDLAGARLALLQLEIPLPTVVRAARLARRHAQVILDPAPAPDALPAELLSCVDVLTPNESEAARLVGRPSHEMSLEDTKAIARQLQAQGASTVIIKLGARGCLLVERDASTHIPAPRVDALDTTAAGDVFNAAFAVARSEGASLLESCQFAVHAAALSVTRLGAQPSMPERSELNTFLQQTVSAPDTL